MFGFGQGYFTGNREKVVRVKGKVVMGCGLGKKMTGRKPVEGLRRGAREFRSTRQSADMESVMGSRY